jgi:transcriptional regulator with XRE-family HTH domain
MEKKKQKADKKDKKNEADDLPTIGKTIEILRTVRGLSQRKLAAISEISQSALSDYESNKKTPQYLRIERLLASMGFYFSAIDQTRAYLSLLYRTHVFARAEDRAEAPGLFLRLKPYPLKAQQAIIREAKEFHVWSLAEFLALESVRIAAEDAEKALELAQLAVTTAEAIGGCTPWLSKLRAFAYSPRERLSHLWRSSEGGRSLREVFRALAGREGRPDHPSRRGPPHRHEGRLAARAAAL